MVEVEIATRSELDVVNVTGLVAEKFTGVGTGVGFIFTPHTTAAIVISEDDEPDLSEDFKTVAAQWLANVGPFRHTKNDNPNTVAHVLSSFAGPSVHVPILDGRLDLGTYQNLLFLEFDGPRTRRLLVDFSSTGGMS